MMKEIKAINTSYPPIITFHGKMNKRERDTMIFQLISTFRIYVKLKKFI